jgi:hypothetical protein
MIAQLKYGSGVPFYRLEKLQENLGVPMPVSTQWEIVEEAAEISKPALEEFIRQAAQGEVLHNENTACVFCKWRESLPINEPAYSRAALWPPIRDRRLPFILRFISMRERTGRMCCNSVQRICNRLSKCVMHSRAIHPSCRPK